MDPELHQPDKKSKKTQEGSPQQGTRISQTVVGGQQGGIVAFHAPVSQIGIQYQQDRKDQVQEVEAQRPKWSMTGITGSMETGERASVNVRQTGVQTPGHDVAGDLAASRSFFEGRDVEMCAVKDASMKNAQQVEVDQAGIRIGVGEVSKRLIQVPIPSTTTSILPGLQQGAALSTSAAPAAAASSAPAPERSPSPPTDDDVGLINELKWLIGKKYSGRNRDTAIEKYIKPYCDERLSCNRVLKSEEFAKLNGVRDNLVSRLKTVEKEEYEKARAHSFSPSSVPT